MRKLFTLKTVSAVFWVCTTAAIVARAQEFTSLVSLVGANGAWPNALVQGTDGNLYGTAGSGGANNICNLGCGTIFKVSRAGTLTTVHSFNLTDGEYPSAPLTLAPDGTFYGTTAYGGTNICNCGTAFRFARTGALTTLYTFQDSVGAEPAAPLLLTDGVFYGTTSQAGGRGGSGGAGFGSTFRMTPAGALTALYTFGSRNGTSPSGLVQAGNGNFYGTTYQGGPTADVGTVFQMTPSGTVTTLHGFGGTTGNNPESVLVQGTDGYLYGTTNGGTLNSGTIFKISPSGTFATLYRFCSLAGCGDGSGPIAGLIQGTDGNFYGSTSRGGSANYGTIFEITPAGTLTTLHSFDSTDGTDPGGLLQYTDGSFYGVTVHGGASTTGSNGTIFHLSLGLGPFVRTVPTSGKAGAAVTILGSNLSGATGVSFNGTAAPFTVVSASEITTAVPAGATTGKIQVNTPGATLASNVAFQVRP